MVAMNFRLHGNDVVDLRGNNVAGVVTGICDIGVEVNLL